MTVSSIKRRILDYSKSKRLGKRTKTTENVGSSLLGNYGKYFLYWGVVILMDYLVDFRLEFLYPAVMFFRSCIDSYQYQGLLLSLLFMALVVYANIFCYTLLNAFWLHSLASMYTWLQLCWHSDRDLSITMVAMWLMFLYFEVTVRFSSVPHYMLNISRPFAAHCIGYPVVTLGFSCKTYITCLVQQHHQKKVQAVNVFYKDLVVKALPQSLMAESHDEPKESPRAIDIKSDSPRAKDDGLEGTSPSSPVAPNTMGRLKGKGTGTGSKGTRNPSTNSSIVNRTLGNRLIQAQTTSGNNAGGVATSIAASTGYVIGGHVANSSGTATKSSSDSSSGNGVMNSLPSVSSSGPVTSSATTCTVAAAVIRNKALLASVTEALPQAVLSAELLSASVSPSTSRSLSSSGTLAAAQLPITTHVSGKKQAAVKAVPREKVIEVDDTSKEAHAKSMNSALLADLEKERSIRRESEAQVSRLQTEVKQLKADLQASQLQEEESVTQKGQLASLEKNHRYDLQRLKTQNDTLSNRLQLMSTSQSEGKATILELEQKLKAEVDARNKTAAELRECRNAITNAFTQEELAGLRKKVKAQEQELASMRGQAKENQQVWAHQHQREVSVLTTSIQSLTAEKLKLVQENKQLSELLAAETKIKINLFSYLSDAKRKEEAMQKDLAWKKNEILGLKHQLAHLLSNMQGQKASAPAGSPPPLPSSSP